MRGAGLSTRAHLVLLVTGLLVPVLAFAGVLAHRYVTAERARFEQEAQETASRIAALIDRDLVGLRTALQTLSTSARIRSGEFEAFHHQALQVKDFIGEHIIVRDLSGQQLASTRLPWGTLLPRASIEGDSEVIAGKRPVISDVFTGVVAGTPLVAIVVPVVQEGEVTHLLSLSISTDRFVPLLREGVKSQWAAGVLDRTGRFVAHSQRHVELSGQLRPPTFADGMLGSQGIWRGTGLLGDPVLLGHAASALTGWRVFAGAPEAVIEAPLTQALGLLAILGAGLISAALLMAYAVGSQIAGSVKALAVNAVGLGHGETVLPARGALREANEVAQALSAASIGLRERARERDIAEAAMRISEARFRQLAEALPQLVWIMKSNGEAIYCNRRCSDFYGESWRDLNGRLSHIHPEDRPTALKLRTGSVAAGRFFQIVVRLRSKNGPYRSHLLSLVPLGADGEDAIWVGTATDIDNLRRAEETNARLAAIVTASADAMMSLSADGRIQSWNRAAEDLFGYTPDEAIGKAAGFLALPDHIRDSGGVFGRAIAGETVKVETVRRAKSGEFIDVAITASPMRATDGTIVGVSVVIRDIRAEKAVARRQQLLINELNHRVKNTLATVQAIAAQTLRSSATDAEARAAFEARLLALSKVHNVLTRENWEAVSLADIATEVLAPHGGEDAARFRIRGPDVRLHPRMALPVAMALHELATNAIKYGSLSDQSGRVLLEWSLEPAADGRRLKVRWAEEGGPAVSPPSRKGFGSRLIERSLAGELDAHVSLAYGTSGVVCLIDAPLPAEADWVPAPAGESRPAA